MYPVTLDYQNKIKENNRVFEAKIQIQHSKGVLEITDKELAQGTLIYTESSQAGEEFTIGSTVASDISFTILNKPEYADIQFIGATVTSNIGLQVKEGIDVHFLQPSQPSEIKGFEEKWEYVPLGRFNVDDAPRQRNTIQIKAIDNMIKFDLPYSLSKLSYPATLYQIYINACNVCDVLPSTTSFPNMHYVVKERPQDDLTFRDIIGYVAELAGCFAKCNRNGALELSWYKSTGLTLGPDNRFDFKPSDDEIRIKGVMASTEDTTYLAESEDYAIDLTENPLLQGDYETVLPNIFDNIKNTVFTPYTSNWQGNPALQAGDMLTQIDRDGKIYNTLITKSTFKYRGRSTLEAKGLPDISKGYKGSTNRKIAQIKRVVEKEVGDKLTNLEQAQINANELMANMLGGYFIEDKENGILYITDNPSLENSTKIWKWGTGGFGYSEDGGVTWKTAITADGSIVAMLISAGIITANMVQTGILTSEDGSSWINLDNGEFNLKDKVKFVNNKFSIEVSSEDLDKNGIYNHNIILGNENQSIISNSSGATIAGTIVTTTVTTLKGSKRIGGTIGTLVLKQSNGTVITTGGATGITLTKGNPTSTADGFVTMSINSGISLPSDSGYIEIPITMDGMGYAKKLTWTKAKSGQDGTNGLPGKDGINGTDGVDGKDARIVTITPSHSYFTTDTISVNIGDYIYSPIILTLTPLFQNCTYSKWFYSTNGTDWNEITSGGNGLTINSTTKVLSISKNSDLYSSTQTSIIFKVTSTTNEYDIITIPRIYDSTKLANRVELKTTDDAIVGAVERKIGGDVTELALKSEVKQTAHSWTAKFDKLMNLNIRYIRDWQNGSVETPSYSYWNEIKVIAKSTSQDITYLGTITASSPQMTSYPLSNWIDKNTSSYARVIGTGWQYLQWDLGFATPDIGEISIKHQTTGRRYNHRLEVSEDGVIWYTLYDSEVDGYYAESSSMKSYILNQIKSGITTINADGIKVTHGSSSQYSEMRADGFIRKWEYGEARYLNDIHIEQNLSANNEWSSPQTLTLTLPERFKGRGSNTKIILIPKNFYTGPLMFAYRDEVQHYTSRMELLLEVVGSDFTLTKPEVYIQAYLWISMRDNMPGKPPVTELYRRISFDLIAIGE